MKKVVVIGGGASGILASIRLKEELKDKVDVTILEKEDRIGKKILKTGNGKCNVTNVHLAPSFYNDEEFVSSILEEYDYEFIKEYLSSLGLLMKIDDEGRVYPVSESAASFLDLLKNKLEENKVNVLVNNEVVKIEQKRDKYVVSTKDNKYETDYIIISSGSRAQVKQYSDKFIKSLGLKMQDEKPGLVSIKVKEKIVSLSGIRVKSKVSLKEKGKEVFTSFGEVLFKDDYLSGIVIMSASRHINGENNSIHLDLLEQYDQDYLLNYLNKLNGNLSGEHILIGVLPKMLSLYILKEVNIPLNKKLKELSLKEKKTIVDKLKNLEFNVVDVNDFDKAQIVMGGISLNEINDNNLMLKKYNNVYAIGEVMDIDGECGGFNLSWAWASALSVADNIKQKVNNSRF